MTPEERALNVVSDWSIDPDVIYPRVLAAIRDTVAAERERCAKIVEDSTADCPTYLETAGDRREYLAAKIRKGT